MLFSGDGFASIKDNKNRLVSANYDLKPRIAANNTVTSKKVETCTRR